MTAPTTGFDALERPVENRVRVLPHGFEIETWVLLQTRAYPSESVRLPFSTILGDSESGSDHGVVPQGPVEGDDTLENPFSWPGTEITREIIPASNPAPDYAEITTGQSPAVRGEEGPSNGPRARPGDTGEGGHRGR